MLIGWGNVFLMAGVVSLTTLLLFQLYRWQRRELSFINSVVSALVCGAGFVIFNFFSLSGLNNDLPIPFFPISPEDMGCGITVLLITLLYGFLIPISANNGSNQTNRWQIRITGWMVPTLVALVIDVYFI